ncbi:MAG TPA: ribose 5-phosphate isomerase A [Nitrososphaeraceae archaeon]
MSKATKQADKNWIPSPYQDAAKNLAEDAIKRFVKQDQDQDQGNSQVIGLGSGPMTAEIVRQMKNRVRNKGTIEGIVTSFQIKLEAQYSGLKIIDESRIPEIDVVFDGADEIDANYNMIKGGGGALLKEKIVHSAAKKVVITAESKKFVEKFTWPVPIEVSPFAISIVARKLEQKAGGRPKLRMLNEGYPYVTENGNFILDTGLNFSVTNNIRKKEIELKNIPGVIEVGLFTRHADVYYKANTDGSFETIEL